MHAAAFFHDQLKRLWTANSLLANWHLPINEQYVAPALQVLPQKYTQFGAFEFAPLITKDLFLETALHFRILRPTTFKGQIADPDNVIKILIDSLKMPQDSSQIPIGESPAHDERPFFVLMQDDGLISKITSTTDELLQPILGKPHIERGDTRIMIDVYIRPCFPINENLIFFSDDFEIWQHNWSSTLDGIRRWSHSELRARTTQCILRMRVTASNFRMQESSNLNDRLTHPASDEAREKAWLERNARYFEQHDEQHMIWNSRLRPVAFALMEELQRRVYGERPYPREELHLSAIEHGMLAGPDPIADAAIGLESLMRRLPWG